MPSFFYHLVFELNTKSSHSDIFEAIANVSKAREAYSSLKSPRYDVHNDWRYGEITVEKIDMSAQETKAVSSSIGHAVRARYVPSATANVELGAGVVHLYREIDETPDLYDDVASSSGEPSDASIPADCTTLCILAVPAYLTPADFLGFVGESTLGEVSHFRMIRTERVNRYMVLMKFRTASAARAWRNTWDGKAFNAMEPENCQVVFVRSVKFQYPQNEEQNFPNNMNDPFKPEKAQQKAPISNLSIKPLAPPTPSLLELPSCPVCLERMDDTTGLLTIQCQHVFHCACLQKWRGSGCPVCRYTQENVSKKTPSSGDNNNPQSCSVCRSESNLWICLICGNVGCGRYDEAHAIRHWEETTHAYAMDMATERVWDYSSDGYVHRLLQNKADGKLVELPGSHLGRRKDDSSGDTFQEKLDNVAMEYSFTLTSQLDSQRMYFEEKVNQAADKATAASRAAEESIAQATLLSKEIARLTKSMADVKLQVSRLERERDRAQGKAVKLTETARNMEKEWKEEKAMNGNLLERVKLLKGEVDSLKTERDDLLEQNRDLSFFISSQDKLQGAGADVREGTLGVVETKKKGKKKG